MNEVKNASHGGQLYMYRKLQMDLRVQRAILNFTPGPQGCISPLGAKLSPRGEFVP
jgi:hypothetical protein